MQAAFGNTQLQYQDRPLPSGPIGARALSEDCARAWQSRLDELLKRAGDNGTARLRGDFTFVFTNGVVITVQAGRWVTFFPKISAQNTSAKDKKNKRSTDCYAVYGTRQVIGYGEGRFSVRDVLTPPVYATGAHFQHLSYD